jgi:putative membrane protein
MPQQTEHLSQLAQQLLSVLVFAILGIVVLKVCLWLIVRYAPFSVVKEIEQDQNTALAIIIGSIVIGMSIIIAAAIH